MMGTRINVATARKMALDLVLVSRSFAGSSSWELLGTLRAVSWEMGHTCLPDSFPNGDGLINMVPCSCQSCAPLGW
ncbi:hypothetical protein SKAU_G00217140 [Synaphobranchus kaupii]|uniref:Uncharacterized protein n=1 Tax=Synaphobranchus kaupii TaxID=118154 RepID=A0A9Q1FA93_SYNKA|nr:hypothetical protein SKAU_G00217140 [Synaphobranchus kaupii]